MVQLLEIELSAIEVVILTDLIYEQAPQFWVDGEWYSPHCLESNSNGMRLIQNYYDRSCNDEATAHGLAPSESLTQEYCAEQDYQRDAQFVDRRHARCGTNL